jgi:hypothetical protein
MLFGRAPYGHAKVVQIVAVFVVIAFLVLTYRSYNSPTSKYVFTEGKTSGRPWKEDVVPEGPSTEVAYLTKLVHKYGLTVEVPWFARRIKASYSSYGRQSMADAGMKFMPAGDFRRVRTDDEWLRLKAEKSAKLTVTKSPMPDRVDASSLLFGISTTYSRITYSNHSLISDWQRWLTDGKGKSNGATLLLALHHATSTEAADITEKLTSVGIDVTIVPSEDSLDMTARYIDLIRTLANRGSTLSKEGADKSYLALVDDDVFFPSLSQLLTRLSKYDPKKEYYIGAPSERSDWIVERNTTVTYGGGAVFLTPPAADNLSQLPCLERNETSSGSGSGSSNSQLTAQWDLLLYECVSKHTSLDMHVLTSFYSPRDELYGLQTASYEAGISPLTLHHYKNRHRFEPGKAHLVASLCGEACFLQRYRFRDDWVLVNGYSVSQYPDGVDVVAMQKGSKLVAQHREEERKAPVNRRLVIDDKGGDAVNDRKVVTWNGRKRTWRFLDSSIGANGEVWQAYVKKRGGSGGFEDGDERLASDVVHTNEEPSDVDSVIVLIWEP